MAFLQIKNVKIKAIAAAVPDQIFHNKDYEWISEKEREILMETTGIRERRFTKPGTCTSDMGVFAADKLISELEWNKNEIELLVFISQSRDYVLPNTACLIQSRLGLSKNCMAFDIPLGCSGYVYGLSVVASLLSHGNIKKALLIAGDVASYDLSYTDKSAYPLFGDAVSVTALEYTGNNEDVFVFNLQTDGSGYEAIIIPDGGNRNNITEESLKQIQYEEGIIRTRRNIFLDGMKIFEFTLREVAKNIKQLLAFLNKTTNDYDYFIFHQANLIMNETVRKQLKLTEDKVPYSLGNFGNTSSASIPLTIVTQLNQKANTENLNYIFTGFGVGLSWASVSVNLDKIYCPEIYIHNK
ncbi:MAG TPA: ketoacyl-ACP synthase III [Chitinophagales bacterium]|nr:ketoacyl-ACP synthase III [Chitinophagales bacterium]